MNMEKVKRVRKISRSAFSKSLNRLETLLEEENPDKSDIQALYEIVSGHAADMQRLNQDVLTAMIEQNCEDEELETETGSVEAYNLKFIKIKLQVTKELGERDIKPNLNQDNLSTDSNSASKRRNFKLPKIELKKFGGDIKEWLQFWSQFKKIHEDTQIGNEDKFQYLLQAMTPGSRASELVQSFPPTLENYDKVIKSLKSRFGRDELLVEVYVRELLKLVLQNAVKPSEKPNLASLYDKLESHIRALESLGVTTETCAAMLYPLVESSLPEELLRAWQRGIVLNNNVESKERLTRLLRFIESEVENEQRITMAVKGFDLHAESEKHKKSKTRTDVKDVPTATGLLTMKSEKTKCIFCAGEHQNQDCEKARQMTLQERQELLKKERCCFSCTKPGHSFRQCRVKLKCPWCSRRHVVIMCPAMSTKVETPAKKSQLDTNSAELNLANFSSHPEVLLQTLRVKLRGEKMDCEVRAIVDNGSQRSYIVNQAADRVNYTPIGKQRLTHTLFGGVKSKEQDHYRYQIRLSSLDGKYVCKFEALANETICSDIPSVRTGPWMDELREHDIEITDAVSDNAPIQILIGADVAGKLMTGRFHILKNGPVAVETLLGWTLMGKLPIDNERTDAVLTVTSMFSMEARVVDLWELDVLGISDPSHRKTREEREEETKNNFLQTVCINDQKRYEVQLPWAEDHPPLPTNWNMAQKRLESTTKKLKSEGYFDEYDKVLREWLAEGIIERVPADEVGDFGHYLPHRHVVKKDSTTNLRPVFDASAKDKNHPSLNLCLEKGPNLIELIPRILMRFRKERIGVVADIRKAFLQISICPRDRDFLRFLWWDEETRLKMEVYRHCRVVFGVSCSPFLLGAVIELHLRRMLDATEGAECSVATLHRLMKSFYVDDCITSVNSIQELHQFMNEATTVMAAGGFELRRWEHAGGDGGGEQTKVLGLVWNKTNDTLEINTSFPKNELDVITKRTILAAAHSVFDPIGFTCPITLFPKILLQETWTEKIDWDTEVCENIKQRFVTWFHELKMLSTVKIPRHMFTGTNHPGDVSLHTFCDASQAAYAAVVYIRVETEEGVKLQLLQAKSRVAPMKKTTIPRLELLAATIGSRLTTSIQEALDWKEVATYMWSDSTTVLSWICRQSQWGTFVWNRVQEIRNQTNSSAWRYVPSEINPADLPSRGCTVSQLLASKWWEGPEWLAKSPQEWPSTSFSVDEEKVQSELKKTATVSMMNCNDENCETWYLRRYSKYRDILRLVAWVRRYVNNSRTVRDERRNGGLSTDEISEAELTVLRAVQKESFGDENDSRLTSLNVFKAEDGLIRLKTKITSRQDTYSFRYPIVLPKQHGVVNRLVYDKHMDTCHAGVQMLLNILREEFWIIGGRRTIRTIIRKCVVCKRHNVKNLESEPAPLPFNRVRDAVAFEISGVDFAGPVFLVGRQKAWICLFTCAVYRAVHLELVTSLSTATFLEAFQRFVARRGRPCVMYSDNGTNFVGAENLFKRIDWKAVANYSTTQRIQWRFNPPTAAWWGGWWERLIGLIKQLLRRVLGKACLSYEEMMTTLCDCESVINSRPITYVSDDSRDLMPLTPAMYLQELREVGVPDCDHIDRRSMIKRLRYRQKLRDDLRQRFRVEYLGRLIQKSKTKEDCRQIHPGDVVLIGCDNLKRLDWPLARVTEIIPGQDGKARVVRLKTSSGEVVRPIQRVYPLELSDNDSDDRLMKEKFELVSKNDKIVVSDPRPLEEKQCSDEKGPTITRSGRVVKMPSRFCST